MLKYRRARFCDIGAETSCANTDVLAHIDDRHGPEGHVDIFRVEAVGLAGAASLNRQLPHHFDWRKRHGVQGRHCSRHCGANRPLLR